MTCLQKATAVIAANGLDTIDNFQNDDVDTNDFDNKNTIYFANSENNIASTNDFDNFFQLC